MKCQQHQPICVCVCVCVERRKSEALDKSGSGQLFQALATSAALIGSQVIGIRAG